MDEKSYPLMSHLKDLRTGLWRSFLAIIVGSLVCYAFTEHILAFLRAPLEAAIGAKGMLVVLTPMEYFFTEMKAALVAGLFVACPFILYQLWLFVAPGLYRNEKKYAAMFVVASASCFIIGALFSYLLVFPPMFKFFVNTLPPGITGSYSVGLLFGFAIHMLLAFGIVFEAPVIVFLLAVMGIVDLKVMKNSRRYVIVLAFIIGALLTPPDPLTQVMLAIPLILLYEVGLLAASICLKIRKPVIPA